MKLKLCMYIKAALTTEQQLHVIIKTIVYNVKIKLRFLTYLREVSIVSNKLESCCLAKERPWVEHLTSPPKGGGGGGLGALLSVTAFSHERAPMPCLQRVDALEANELDKQ